MNQEQLQNQISLYYSRLSPEAQESFSSMKWMETLGELNKKYSLDESQIETLATETTLVMLGIIQFGEYQTILENELGLPYDQANNLIKEVNDLILEELLPHLNKAFNENADILMEEKYGGMKKLDERFNSLPKEVQGAIKESDYQEKLYRIADEKELSIDQMNVLEEVTNKVLLNVIHPDKYEEELKNKLGLDSTVVSEIVNKVNEEILKNIREILRTNWEKSKGVAQEGEDEVPLPPYAVVKTEAPKTFTTVIPKPVEITPKTESGIYKSAGIEMMKDEPETGDVMKSIIGSKLNAPTVSKPVISNQTIPKITPAAPTTPKPLNITQPQVASPAEKPHDPYHEAV